MESLWKLSIFITIVVVIGNAGKAYTRENTGHDWYSSNGKSISSTNQIHSKLARDSYADAAASVSAANSIQPSSSDHLGSYAQPIRYHYQMYPDHSQTHNSYSNYPSYYPAGGTGAGEYGVYGSTGSDYDTTGHSGGATGLIGLLGLKGLTGLLPIFGPLLGFLFGPLLLLLALPLLIPLAIVLLALLLFIPVPVVSIPNGRRDIKEFFISDDCIERITCEATRFARNSGFNPAWVQDIVEKTMENGEIKWLGRVSKGMKGSSTGDCANFTCHPSSLFNKNAKKISEVVKPTSSTGTIPTPKTN